MKSLIQLHLSLLRNVGAHCSIDITRDVETTSRRYEEEGDGYLTITLPRFAKALEKGLAQGYWPAHDVAPTWHHVKGLPSYLSGFLSRIFDKRTGVILETPDAECIWAVRQFCYLTHKIEMPCTPERVQAALDQFVSTDRSLLGLPSRIEPTRLERFAKVSQRLFGRMFQECDRKIAHWELVPKHGPGAVAERLSQEERRMYAYWTERLQTVFPDWRYTTNLPQKVRTHAVPITDELPVRVVDVPKTQSTPRIIAIEPSAMQYAQQGLKREFYEMIGRGSLSKILGFQDQERNRKMAKLASETESLATLDLSEASDRVHWFLVYTMLRPYPHLWEFVWATRSHRAEVSGYGVMPLQKFASMGSALTFPIEAMVFTTLVTCGIEQTEHRSLSASQLQGRVSVYGDDLIIPTDAIDHVVDWLEHFGAKVNRSKSFWTGGFRESCGAEYYRGHDVSVIRARSELPSSRDDAANIAGLVDLRNRAYKAGLWSFTADLDAALEPFIKLPVASATQDNADAFLHRSTFLKYIRVGSRWNADLQRDERKVPVLIPRATSYKLDGESGLLEWFHDALRRDDLVDRFDSKERASSFSIKRRWVCATI